MRKSILAFWIIYGFMIPQRMMALDAAFATNGVIVAVPVQMPVVGVRLDTRQTVLNLYQATPQVRVACGYFECKAFDRSTVPTNCYVKATAWKIEGNYAVQTAVTAEQVRKTTLSRTKLAELAKQMGWSTNLIAFVSSDPVVAVRWYSTEKLVAESEEMKPFIEGFFGSVGIPYKKALEILQTCKED